MAGENVFLKRLCVASNVILGIFGGAILLIGILTLTFNDGAESIAYQAAVGGIVCCLVGSFISAVSLLGAYVALKERSVALRVYFALLLMMSIGFVKFIVALPSARPKMEDIDNAFINQIPLDQANSKIQLAMNQVQTVSECCGLHSYHDWGSKVPDSCKCPTGYADEATNCQSISQSVQTPREFLNTDYEIRLYVKPCGPVLFNSMDKGFRLVLGITVTLAVLMVISAILSLMLYCG